jgi:hypothetical protein
MGPVIYVLGPLQLRLTEDLDENQLPIRARVQAHRLSPLLAVHAEVHSAAEPQPNISGDGAPWVW